MEGLMAGFANMDKHIHNMQQFGQTVVICLNRFDTDSDDEIQLIRKHCERLGVGFAVNNAFKEGGKGAEEFAQLVVKTIEENPSKALNYCYSQRLPSKYMERKMYYLNQPPKGRSGVFVN